jgi:hypothetical protein
MRYLRPSGAKKRLNRVFDAIGFVYPNYRYPPRVQKRKGATSGKVAASAAPSEPAPKSKKLKVLTHRPRYIEPAVVPEFGGEASSAAAPKEPIPSTQKVEEPAILLKAPSAKLAEPKTDKTGEPRIKGTKTLEILSPSTEVTMPKAQKGLAATPKRKRMASVLDVLETVKASSSTPEKIAKASKVQIEAKTKLTEAKAAMSQASVEAEPSEPVKEKPSEIGEKAAEEETIEQILPEKVAAPAPEAPSEDLGYVIRHASGKRYLKKKFLKLNTMPENWSTRKGP